MIRHRITFITPQFSKGCREDQAEIRPPSIRGQLRWWFRALGGGAEQEKKIFGGVNDKTAAASRVVARVANIQGQTGAQPTLPHKSGNQASPKEACLAGSSFDLLLSYRLGGLQTEDQAAFERALDAWLLAGSLGLRATRAGGSFRWDGQPATLAAYQQRLATVFQGAPLRVNLSESQLTWEEARHIVSDTIGGGNQAGATDLRSLRYPLGSISPQRKTSPLRFRIVQLGQHYHILAVWDDRSYVTGNQPTDYAGVKEALDRAGKRIANHLKP